MLKGIKPSAEEQKMCTESYLGAATQQKLHSASGFHTVRWEPVKQSARALGGYAAYRINLFPA